ncbi:hypothetical protein AUC70_11765 [Methyloceanibacter stevinii]|uniref:Phage head morphogenesis domain-containing protein n=1 Tax=Methyloceanibacter stevinii TaxID=1774970 RepID=A0A1E3VJ45_9HYPH|nr:phage minor head protein [Methyloceanibacter stevinii]ODR93534.1 hypothetical protein AUC70_11765 [Methyloceanibacter stevinii]
MAEGAARKAADDMRRDLLEAVRQAMAEGRSLESFRDDYLRIIERYGWMAPGDNPGWHAELVYRVQTANAHAAGRWAQIQRVKTLRPYLRYVTAGDHKVRHTHREWHGIVLPVDHRFWLTHYTPNGFGCRCYVQSVGPRDLKRYGWTITPDDDPALTIPPDKGWEGNVGIAWERLRAA